jgi:hypothetical protein
MTVIYDILRGLVGLFIDDEFLAVAIIVVIAMTAGLIVVLHVAPLAAGAFLLLGNVVVLVVGAFRTANKRS